MSKKYKILSEDVVNGLIEFLDEVQFDAVTEGDAESIQKVNFCNWAIGELLNSFDGYIKETPKKKPKHKSRDQYVDETFMDWNLPEMTDKDYEKLVDQFDGFLRKWEKEYSKKHPKKKIKRELKFKPNIEDVNQYMSLDEIKEYLLDDPELDDEERFDLYYGEHKREERKKERRRQEREAKPIDQIMKDLGMTFSDGTQTLPKKKK